MGRKRKREGDQGEKERWGCTAEPQNPQPEFCDPIQVQNFQIPLSQSSFQAELRKFKLAKLIFFIFWSGNSQFLQSRLNSMIYIFTLSQSKLLENHTLQGRTITNNALTWQYPPPPPPFHWVQPIIYLRGTYLLVWLIGWR